MTPADRDEFRRMLASALQPMQEQIDAIKIPLAAELEELKGRTAKLSGQHRQVLGELIPKIVTKAEEDRTSDLSAVVTAMQRLLDMTNAASERQARTEENVALILRQNQAAVVHVSDGRSVSIKPASLIAAESSVRTETATGLMQVDVTSTKKETAALTTWQKRVTTPLLVLVPVLIEIYRQLFHH